MEIAFRDTNIFQIDIFKFLPSWNKVSIPDEDLSRVLWILEIRREWDQLTEIDEENPIADCMILLQGLRD